MAQPSPTPGLPASCARGFPWGTPQCWRGPCCSLRCNTTKPALPCRQLVLLPGPACACTSPDCKKYCRSCDVIPGLEDPWQSLPLLLCSSSKGGTSKVIPVTRHFLTLATCPHQGEETSLEDHHREENCTGYSHFFILVTTADLRGVLSLGSSCWERWGWTLRGVGLPWELDTSGSTRGEMDEAWGSCWGVRGCVRVPGAAAPADGGSWAKLASANPWCGALQARAGNYSWQREPPAIVPWGEGNSTLPPFPASQCSSVRGLYSPDTPHEDVLQESWYKDSLFTTST